MNPIAYLLTTFTPVAAACGLEGPFIGMDKIPDPEDGQSINVFCLKFKRNVLIDGEDGAMFLIMHMQIVLMSAEVMPPSTKVLLDAMAEKIKRDFGTGDPNRN